MKKQTPETPILREICEYLDLKGYLFWRQNNIAVYDPKIKKHRKMPKYSMYGVSDILVLYKGQSLFIEVKIPKGIDEDGVEQKKTYQSKEQKEFQKKVEENGCMYLVVRSLEDISDIL